MFGASRSTGMPMEPILDPQVESFTCSSSLTSSSSMYLRDEPLHGRNSGFTDTGTLYGRSDEIKLLTDAYKHVRSREPIRSSRVALLYGPPGSGKTALYEALREPIVMDGAFFVVGKSDQLHTSHSFYTLASPLSDLCDLLAQQQHCILTQIKHDLTTALNREQAQVLASIIGALPKLTGIEANTESPSELHQDLGYLKTACLCFLRIISKPSSPVVLVLDDLQWGDDQSLELLRLLLSDPSHEMKNLLMILSYTVDDSTQLSHLQLPPFDDSSLHIQRSTFHSPSNHLRLGPLGTSHIEMMLSESLHVTRSAAEPLAELVHRKTSGLPGDVAQFIDLLRSESLLVCRSSGSWEWDVDQIHSMKQGFCA